MPTTLPLYHPSNTMKPVNRLRTLAYLAANELWKSLRAFAYLAANELWKSLRAFAYLAAKEL